MATKVFFKYKEKIKEILNDYYNKNEIDSQLLEKSSINHTHPGIETIENINITIEKLKEKYDNIELKNNSLFCYANGEEKKIIPLEGLILTNYYEKSYIDENCIINVDITSEEDGIYLNITKNEQE